MEPVDVINDTNSLFRYLYLIGLSIDLFPSLLLVIPVLLSVVGSGSQRNGFTIFFIRPFITDFIITVMIDAVGWIGYCTNCIFPMVVYGIALFLQNVYMLVSIVDSGVPLLFIILVIRVTLSILVLRCAYVLIAERWRRSHVERNIEAPSMEPVNVNNETCSMEPVNVNDETTH